jgi:hypothetical protein
LNLKYNKDIKNNVFICDVIFDSYGTPLLTPEVEKSYVESFVPTIQYKDLSFKRYFNVVNNNVVEDKGTVNYINTLSINIPTSVIANPVTAGSAVGRRRPDAADQGAYPARQAGRRPDDGRVPEQGRSG